MALPNRSRSVELYVLAAEALHRLGLPFEHALVLLGHVGALQSDDRLHESGRQAVAVGAEDEPRPGAELAERQMQHASW